MKHAIGILAHKASEQLKWLITSLVEQDADVYVHADFKTRDSIIKVLGNLSVHIIPKSIDVKRAHYSLLEASLLLMKEADKKPFDYFHLISGEDLLVKPLKTLDPILLKSDKSNFINYNSLPLNNEVDDSSNLFNEYSVRRDRIPISNYMHYSMQYGKGLYASRQFPGNKAIAKLSRRFGKYRSYWRVYHSLFKRKVPDKEFFLGSAWFSITHELLQFIISETEKNTHFYTFFKRVAYPDEIYFQTLVLNSPFRSKVINSDLRYINWDKLENGGPSYLSQKNADEIRSSNGFFARKWQIDTLAEYKDILNKLHA